MHIPVLFHETLEYLNVKKGGKFVDGTTNGGGHLLGILSENQDNHVLGIDLDQTTLQKLNEKLVQNGLDQRVKLVSGNYSHIDKILSELGWDRVDPVRNESSNGVDGILLDLGFSSHQLEDPNRGFSFVSEGPLDMRYDRSQELTAATVVNKYHPKDLEKIILEYGEERFAPRIVAKIVEKRKETALATAKQLAEVIRKAVPLPIRFKASDNIRRVFQAIRIEVNKELENLRIALPKMFEILNSGGRLVVISFHSLEDRIVKGFFTLQAKGCVCPPEFPTCVCGKTSTARILTRKPITASEQEISNNPRSKSAKLRAIEKLK